MHVAPFQTQDTEQVTALLLATFSVNNPQLTRGDWVRLLSRAWPGAEVCRGYVLWQETRAVGFAGLLTAERRIAGRTVPVSNLTSVVVLPEHRRHSLLLFQALMDNRQCAITSFTPTGTSGPLLQRIGFRALESTVVHLFPRVFWPVPLPVAQGARLAAGFAAIREQLRGDQRRIGEDHADLDCDQLLLTRGGEQCHLVFTRTHGWRFEFSVLHHISNVPLFLACLPAVRWQLFRRNRTLRLMVDKRLLRGQAVAGAREIPLETPRLYRADGLAPGEMDNLYSEFVVLPHL
jgi:hypothetical protein